MLEEPTYENTDYISDDDDLPEAYFKRCYARGIRFICILKWGQCLAINKDGLFDHERGYVPCSAQLIEKFWEDYNS